MKVKSKQNKCQKCGSRIILGTMWGVVCVEPDQEPYEANVIEPVIVDRQEIHNIEIEISADCHICPKCDWIIDIISPETH